MKTLSILTSVVAAALFTFSGCADKPNPTEGAVNEPASGSVLGKVTVVHSDAVLPVDFFTDLATGCIEGSLHLTGELHAVTEMVLDDETGMWKLKNYHDNWVGVTAVTESGVAYKVIRVHNYPRVTGGAWEATYVDVLRLIGPAGETGALLKTHNHLTFTPNGDVSVEFYNTSIECK